MAKAASPGIPVQFGVIILKSAVPWGISTLTEALDTHKAARLISAAESASSPSACPSSVMGGQKGHV